MSGGERKRSGVKRGGRARVKGHLCRGHVGRRLIKVKADEHGWID